jgi:hypothetical protein
MLASIFVPNRATKMSGPALALPVILTICFFLPYTSLLRPSARRLASIASTPRWLPARSRVPTGHLLTPGVSVGRLPALKLAPPLSR